MTEPPESVKYIGCVFDHMIRNPFAMTTTDTLFKTSNGESDVILRCSDMTAVDLRIPKVFLTMASPFFATLLTPPQPQSGSESKDAPEVIDGAVVIPIEETSQTARKTLLFCFPRYVAIDSFNSLEELKPVMQMASKYDMAGVLKCIGDILIEPRFVESDPMRVFALACRYGMANEAKIAARQTLRLSISERPYVPELEYLTAGALHRLHEYYFQCASAAGDTASSFVWITNESYCWFTQVNVPGACRCSDNRFIAINQGTRNLHARVWWCEYMQALGKALQERPHTSTILDDQLMEQALEKTKTCSCARATALELPRFRQTFVEEVERRIGEVHFFGSILFFSLSLVLL